MFLFAFGIPTMFSSSVASLLLILQLLFFSFGYYIDCFGFSRPLFVLKLVVVLVLKFVARGVLSDGRCEITHWWHGGSR